MEVKNLNKFYGSKQVVENVSFELPKNKVISFIGPNGAGKSTVLNIMTRLISSDSGQVLLENKDLKKWNSKELAKKIAILTQTNHITAKLTVAELVAFGRFPYSGSNLNKEDRKHINMAIEYMELQDFKNRFIDELSGGQRQRVFIAMVLAQDTEYIFLDEPTNNLDIYHSSNMMKLVRRLCDDLNKTVTLVLHEINFASAYSDYIGAFKNGKLYKFDTVHEVMTKDNLKSLYNVNFDITDFNGKPISIYY
ncbi:MAG: iron ABC transporter ATP-binding protein [Candidatus Epulonipiscioides saccharophilum]|nr:MAG: iron ABC transporter ATP-binding protein [Epulopiscium sp. AS2M-Bin001]